MAKQVKFVDGGIGPGDEVIAGGSYGVIVCRKWLKSGRRSKVARVLYYDGSSREVPVKFCKPTGKYYSEVANLFIGMWNSMNGKNREE